MDSKRKSNAFMGKFASIKHVTAILICSIVILFSETIHSQDGNVITAELFQETSGAVDMRGEDNRTVLRSRAVHVNVSLLNVLRDSDGGEVILNLFDNVRFVASFKKAVVNSSERTILFGDLRGIPQGTVSLALGNDIVIGYVRTPAQGAYRIVYLGDGVHSVREIDPSQYPSCGGAVRPTSRKEGNEDPDIPIESDREASRNIQDVLVVYTPAARSEAGGTDAMLAEIDLAVAETNEGYINSGVNPILRLVGTNEVGYTESGSTLTDLERLQVWGDAILDEVHAIRDAVGADLVCLIVADGDYCGTAYIMTPAYFGFAFQAWAFSVVRLDCATSNYTFGHEIGHNQGCNHDRDHAGDYCLFDYSYGHRWTGESGTEWITVMSYYPGTLINYYSNPNVYYDGRPTGVDVWQPDSAYNALTINNSASTIAGFRNEVVRVIWVDFNYMGYESGTFEQPFNTVAEGRDAVQPGSLLLIKSGTTPETLTINKDITIEAYRGVVTIGD